MRLFFTSSLKTYQCAPFHYHQCAVHGCTRSPSLQPCFGPARRRGGRVFHVRAASCRPNFPGAVCLQAPPASMHATRDQSLPLHLLACLLARLRRRESIHDLCCESRPTNTGVHCQSGFCAVRRQGGSNLCSRKGFMRWCRRGGLAGRIHPCTVDRQDPEFLHTHDISSTALLVIQRAVAFHYMVLIEIIQFQGLFLAETADPPKAA